jgi:uncharacterized membrane protein YedE/YeeE
VRTHAPLDHLVVAGLGLIMGFSLSRIGFSEFREVHRMFTFADWRLLATFAGALVLTALGFGLLFGQRPYPPRPIHPGTLPGGVLFGLGWAVTGACPAIALVQLGEGRAPAALTLVGIALGSWLYPKIHGRWFRWDRGGCDV